MKPLNPRHRTFKRTKDLKVEEALKREEKADAARRKRLLNEGPDAKDYVYLGHWSEVG